jgi:hypothetical protein
VEEDTDLIEDDFTRSRTRDLELVDDEDEEGEEQFLGFSGDEERELVRAFASLIMFFLGFSFPLLLNPTW